MQTIALINAENLLSEIYVMIAAQRGNKTIDSDLIFKLNELQIQIDPILREVRYNKREIEQAAFIRYRDDLTRVFANIIKSVDSLLPRHQIVEAENSGTGPDGFDINNDYTVTNVQQFLHDCFYYLDGAIDREFSEPGTDIELPELNTINEKLLLLKYTGLYEQVKTICDNNKKRMSELIGAITGLNARAVQVSINYIDTPGVKNKNNPYTPPAIEKITNTLTHLNIDPSQLRAILLSQNK